MNELPDIPPASRSWREIPQQVKPRAMSREGRRRYVAAALKTAGVAAFIAMLLAGGGWLAKTWSDNPALLSAMSGQPPVRTLVLETNGRLNQEWVRATLALPDKITLMEVDLAGLRARLLRNPQVSEAAVTKLHPAALSIRLTERSPVARVAGPGGEVLLVARDGVAFPGACFSAEDVAALPLLTGVEPDAQGGAPAVVAGMDTVADLLSRARDLAPHLRERWTGLDLSRLESDGLVEVRSVDIPRIIFSKSLDFSDQLARLDQVHDKSSGPLRMVDLGLGPRVIAEPAVPEPAAKPGARPAVSPAARPAAVSATAPAPVFRLNFEN